MSDFTQKLEFLFWKTFMLVRVVYIPEARLCYNQYAYEMISRYTYVVM